MNSKWLFGLMVALALSSVHGQGLTDEEKAEILNAHNHFRGQVDPIATNMLKMVRTTHKQTQRMFLHSLTLGPLSGIFTGVG